MRCVSNDGNEIMFCVRSRWTRVFRRCLSDIEYVYQVREESCDQMVPIANCGFCGSDGRATVGWTRRTTAVRKQIWFRYHWSLKVCLSDTTSVDSKASSVEIYNSHDVFLIWKFHLEGRMAILWCKINSYFTTCMCCSLLSPFVSWFLLLDIVSLPVKKMGMNLGSRAV